MKEFYEPGLLRRQLLWALFGGLCGMILVPLSGAVIDRLPGDEEVQENLKQTAFASYQNNDIQVDRGGNQVVVTVYKSRFSWIIQKTRTCYPKNMSRWWDVTELEVPEALSMPLCSLSLQFSNGWLIFPLLTFTAKCPLLKPSTAVKMISLRFVLNPRTSLTSQLPLVSCLTLPAWK